MAAAQQKLSDGSFAFLEAMGATDALNALTQSTYAAKTIKGDPADATSLNNMKATIQWLKRCNELRSQHGLAPLMVSDRLMAMAQADANYSDTVIGHAMQFSLGENCAWNYGSDPFIQWYDQEKAQYEATKDSGKAGHYFNIISSGYTATGFAICTRGSMNGWMTYTQTFTWNDANAMSVEAYEARLLAYCESVTGGADAALTAEQEQLQNQLAGQTQKAQELAAAQATAADTQAYLEQMKAASAQAASQYEEKKAETAAAKQAASEAETKLQEAKEQEKQAENLVSEKQAVVSEKEQVSGRREETGGGKTTGIGTGS